MYLEKEITTFSACILLWETSQAFWGMFIPWQLGILSGTLLIMLCPALACILQTGYMLLGLVWGISLLTFSRPQMLVSFAVAAEDDP